LRTVSARFSAGFPNSTCSPSVNRHRSAGGASTQSEIRQGCQPTEIWAEKEERRESKGARLNDSDFGKKRLSGGLPVHEQRTIKFEIKWELTWGGIFCVILDKKNAAHLPGTVASFLSARPPVRAEYVIPGWRTNTQTPEGSSISMAGSSLPPGKMEGGLPWAFGHVAFLYPAGIFYAERSKPTSSNRSCVKVAAQSTRGQLTPLPSMRSAGQSMFPVPMGVLRIKREAGDFSGGAGFTTSKPAGQQNKNGRKED